LFHLFLSFFDPESFAAPLNNLVSDFHSGLVVADPAGVSFAVELEIGVQPEVEPSWAGLEEVPAFVV